LEIGKCSVKAKESQNMMCFW